MRIERSDSGDEKKSKKRLIRELSEIRKQLNDEKQRNRGLARELAMWRQTGTSGIIRLYRAIAANLPMGAAFVVDRDLRYLLAEGQALEIGMTTSAELEGKTVREALDADLADRIESCFRRALYGETFHLEHIVRGRYHCAHFLPLRDGAGAIYAALAVAYDITERKRAEAALRESERRLSAILEQLPVGVGVLNPEGRFTLSNTVLRNYIPKVLPSKDPSRIDRWRAMDADGRPIPPERWPGARALRGEAVSPGVEFVYTADDGRELRMLESTAPFRAEDDEIIGAIAVVQDITERKLVELERDRFFDLSADMLVIASARDGSWRRVNPAVIKTLGWSEEELRGIPYAELIHPEDLLRSRRAIAELASGKPLRDFEHRVRCKDGAYKWVAWNMAPYWPRI